jgi:UDP:flavonoid glycosyltransferase YjiC (YdhE family)
MMGWPTSLSFLPGYNKLGYSLYERLTFLTMKRTIKRWRVHSLGLPPISGSAYLSALNRQPLLYGYSSQVVPRPLSWPDHIHVTGYWQPNDEIWQPPPSLVDFLEAGRAPVFIGFGSMPIEDPQATTQMILDAVGDGGYRAIIQSGWAGLGQGDLPENVYRLEYAPYSWLFPRMAAVIHHGGSGTTAAGLRAGVPSMIVPFTFDQGFWGRRTTQLGVGTQLVPFRELSAATLTGAMRQLVWDVELRERAAALGRTLRTEDGMRVAVDLLRSYLPGSVDS